jgi:hypothetical protein
MPAARVNYVAFSGGGESLAALVGGQVSVGVSGLAEFAPHIEAGTIRALAISSAVRLPGLDLPTLREQGVDVEFENWRSVVAPPGISREDRDRLDALVADMVRSPEWREALRRYRWLDRYLSGRPFAEFVSAEEARVAHILGQFGGRNAGAPVSARSYPLIVLAGLLATVLAVIVQAVRSTARAATSRAWDGWRPLAVLTAGIVLNLALAERAGFVLASGILFWCTARAFDPRYPVRDAVFAIAMAAGTYALFARVLQLPLPLGPLARLL